MNKLGKVVVILVVATIFMMPISAMRNETREGENCKTSSALTSGMFIQLPTDPGYSTFDFYGWRSSVFAGGYQCYENFWDVAGPICGIHWWGFSTDLNTGQSLEPEGMIFTITFYEDNDSRPGDMVYSYVDIEPSITKTEIVYYEFGDWWELYFFEYDLGPCCDLSDGWVSIFETGSDNDCLFRWLGPKDDYGDGLALIKSGEQWEIFIYDFSVVLTDGEATGLEIVDVQGGLGATLEIRNNGAETVNNYPVDFLVMGGASQLIQLFEKDAGATISNLGPGESITIDTGPFFGFGPFKIFVVGDGIDMYKNGLQLFMLTLVF